MYRDSCRLAFVIAGGAFQELLQLRSNLEALDGTRVLTRLQERLQNLKILQRLTGRLPSIHLSIGDALCKCRNLSLHARIKLKRLRLLYPLTVGTLPRDIHDAGRKPHGTVGRDELDGEARLELGTKGHDESAAAATCRREEAMDCVDRGKLRLD